MNCCCEFEIELNEYPSFKLENAVCNRGFFMMAPNVWDSFTNSFSRPFRLANSRISVHVSISQLVHKNCLLVKVHDHINHLSSFDKNAILGQVKRMLRLSPEDEKHVQVFQNIHLEAKEKGFGRIFRSPSLFEDAIKCFLLCFCRKLTQKHNKIKGFGSYASANVRMCLSFYKDVPVDSKTQRDLKQIHGKENCTPKVIKEIYGEYAPFQCLAFWYELVVYCESKVGKLREVPSSKYSAVTGNLMGKTKRKR